MNKSGILIATALLSVGFAAASLAADVPNSTEAAAADQAAQKHHGKKHHHHKHAEQSAVAPATTK